MKKQIIPYLLALLLSGSLSFRVSAQEGMGIAPYSSGKAFLREYGARPPAVTDVAPPDLKPVLADDARFGWPRFAVGVPVSFDLHRDGEWLNLGNGDRLWRLHVRAQGAEGLTVQYEDFYLPPESRMHLYNKDKSRVLGAFSSFNNPGGGRFATAMIPGEELILEYYEPAFCRGQARLVIDGLGYVYRGSVAERSGSSDSLYINCPQGPGVKWQREKRGVLVLLVKFKYSKDVFWCNGALLNNTAGDKTPFVLTSYDGMYGPAHASSIEPALDEIIFYFNWEYRDCEGPAFSPNLVSMVGCTLASSDQATNTLLLKIKNAIPPSPYAPYFLGWDNTDAVPANPVCLYVPANGFKRLAFFDTGFAIPNDAVPSPVDSSLNYAGNLFLQSNWDDPDFYVPPGAPLFDSTRRIRGVHFKTGGGCSGKNIYFSRFHQSWPCRLSPVLDPGNTGATALNGLEGGCGNFTGPVVELDQAVMGKLSKFISKALQGNYKIMERAYIRHQREIDLALTSDDPKYRQVRAALETLKQRIGQTYFKAFVFEKENLLSEEDVAVWKHFLQELGKAVGSVELTREIQKVSRLFDVAAGKDLKSGLIAFDRASFAETSVVNTPAPVQQMNATLLGNPGIVTTLRYELPYAGNVAIELIDSGGTLRKMLRSGYEESGIYTFEIDKQELPPGVYFVRCVLNGATGQQQCVQKLIVQ